MIRAILSGTKSMTRRVVKGAWHEEGGYLQSEPEGDEDGEWCFSCHKVPASFITTCPYGRVKDHLWCKETCSEPGGSPHYRADEGEDHSEVWKWAPSIFMPRRLSRITLEITGVRVERLQDISEEDAKAEGVDKKFVIAVKVGDKGWNGRIPNSYRGGFCCAWNEINGKREGCSWVDNPFVFAISFKRIKPSTTSP